MLKKISGVIITLNEEKNIAAAVNSLKLICEEVVVVDSLSTDRTCEIAQSQGARVITQAYLGDGAQKRFAAEQASHDWVFSLDADERLTPELVEELKNIDFESTPFEAFSVCRKNFIGSRWIKVAGWYPDRLIRLYRKSQVNYPALLDHSEVKSENAFALRGSIEHYSFKHLGELFSKADFFSSYSAKVLYLQGRKCKPWDPFLHGLAAFLKKFIFQGGILGGLDGWTISLSAFVHHYLKYAKLLELHRDPLAREPLLKVKSSKG